MRNRLVITGVGAVTPFGVGTPALYDGLDEDRSPFGPLDGMKLNGLAVGLGGRIAEEVGSNAPPLVARANRYCRLIHTAAAEAVAHAGLTATGAEAYRVGVAVGTMFAEPIVETMQAMKKKIGSQYIYPNTAASIVAIMHGFRGPLMTFQGIGASSGEGFDHACRHIRVGKVSAFVIGGCDLLSRFAYLFYHGLNEIADPGNVDCRPYGCAPTGPLYSEASCFLVVEDRAQAQARSATILAEIAGVGMSSGDGLFRRENRFRIGDAMRVSLSNAQVQPGEVDVVFGAASGSGYIDEAEAAAINELFGDGPYVTAVASRLGSAQGAAPFLNIACALRAFETGRSIALPRHSDERGGLRYVRDADDLFPRVVVCNGVSIGGKTVSITLKGAHFGS